MSAGRGARCLLGQGSALLPLARCNDAAVTRHSALQLSGEEEMGRGLCLVQLLCCTTGRITPASSLISVLRWQHHHVVVCPPRVD
jgi:hypothetical protein